MDYLTSGNSYVFWGTVLVAAGAFFFSAGWFLLSICKQADKCLKKQQWFKSVVWRRIVISLVIIFLLVFGSWLVGKGGTETTKGWNIISLGEQRNNLIRAISQELYINIKFLEMPPLKGEVHYLSKDGKWVLRPFPILKTNAIKAFLSSGLWDAGKQTELNFINTIYNYETKIGIANNIFGQYNESLLAKEDPNEAIELGKKLQRCAPEKEYFKSLNNIQSEVTKLILSEYKWAIQTQLPEAYELFQKIFQEESTVSKSEEGISKKEQ